MELKRENRKVNLEISAGGHNSIRLENIGQWREEDSIYYITKEKDISSIHAIKMIHTQLNHKKAEEMQFAYISAGRLDDGMRKNIKQVVKNCNICLQNGRSRSKLSMAISKASDFVSIITLNFKKFGKMHVLWLICA